MDFWGLKQGQPHPKKFPLCCTTTPVLANKFLLRTDYGVQDGLWSTRIMEKCLFESLWYLLETYPLTCSIKSI